MDTLYIPNYKHPNAEILHTLWASQPDPRMAGWDLGLSKAYTQALIGVEGYIELDGSAEYHLLHAFADGNAYRGNGAAWHIRHMLGRSPGPVIEIAREYAEARRIIRTQIYTDTWDWSVLRNAKDDELRLMETARRLHWQEAVEQSRQMRLAI